MDLKRRTIRLLVAWVAILFAGAPALADDPLVYATIQPAQIYLGESAQFVITNLGESAPQVPMQVV